MRGTHRDVRALLAVSLILSWSRPGEAQTSPARAQTGAVAGVGASPGFRDVTNDATGSATNATTEDPFVQVADPMLAPVPRAPKALRSWRDALALVRTRSPTLQIAYSQIEVARGRSRMALAGALPRLTATGQASHQLITPAQDPGAVAGFFPATVATGRLELLVPLLSARNWYDYATAKQNVERAALDAAATERKVIAGLAEALVAVVTAERLSEVTRVNLSSALSNLELNRRRERLGAANSIDVLRAEQEVARSRATLIEADEALRQSRESLGIALGYDEAWGVDQHLQIDELRDDAKATCTEGRDVLARPDVRAARAAERVAERNVTSVDLSYLPTINGQTTVIASTNNFSTGSRGPVGWSIGALLTWPLYEGGYRYGEKRQNAGLLEVTRQQTRELQRAAHVEVTRAYRGVDVAAQNLELSRASLTIAESSARLTRMKYVNGNGTSFDMVDTQRSAREAAIDVTIREFELLRAEVIAFLALASCDI